MNGTPQVSLLCSQRLRDGTITALIGKTDAEDRIYATPIIPWRRDRPLPALGVYTLAERGAPFGTNQMGPVQLRMSCDLSIDVLIELPTDDTLTPDGRLRLDTATPLDLLCEQVMNALLPVPSWVNLSEGVERWERRTVLGPVGETDRRTAAATITITLNDSCIYEPVITDQLDTIVVGIDVIDPAADPNTTGHPTEPPPHYPGGYPGPDGRIEVDFTIPPPGSPPLWPPTKGRG